MHRQLAWAVIAAVAAASTDPSRPLVEIRPAALRAHMSFLADDLLEGRGTATRGYDIAARYVAAQFEAAGLEPGLNGGWFQQVPLRRSELDPEASSLEVIRPGGERSRLAFAQDYVMSAGFQPTGEVEAPVVFVGYGVTAPELNHDDYAGVDAKGKIVAPLGGAPAAFRIEERAYTLRKKARMRRPTAPSAHCASGAPRTRRSDPGAPLSAASGMRPPSPGWKARSPMAHSLN